jgi:formate dehydrogenase iron-sulfur subunit
MKVFVPCDSAAVSVGADHVAAAVAAEFPHAEIIRNGSRGLLWLEPMLELEVDSVRHAFGPVQPADIPSLNLNGQFMESALYLGVSDQIPWLAKQQRWTFERVGIVDPASPEDFLAHGGLAGLKAAMEIGPSATIEQVIDSGLRGRGGAGFPTGIKWRTVAQAAAAPHAGAPAGSPTHKYVCVNADEGDSGTFADRMLMEGDPFTLIEGILIAGYAVGADHGYIYIRSEYPAAIHSMQRAIELSRERGWLGNSIMATEFMASEFNFDLEVRIGAGSYVCGEETAMLESLEGKRGMVRPKPPLPALEGLFGVPTVINNVISIGSVPAIMSRGATEYAALGTERSQGTSVYQLAGNIARGGIVETGFDVTLRELVGTYGGGTLSGRPIRAVQVGGPLGAYLNEPELDVTADYESLLTVGGMLGHGGIVVFDDTVDMADQAKFAMQFCAEESCGKCTPCRIGSTRGAEVIDLIIKGVDTEGNKELLEDLCEVMRDGSLCAMGGLTPLPVLSALHKFSEDFDPHSQLRKENA